MPQAQEESTAPVRESAAPLLRVLAPSPIGSLGVELTGSAVSRLRIEPAEPERSTFTPLDRVDGSDLLDEVFGRLSEYFAGARRKLDLDFDLASCGMNALARRVLRETAKIPYGRTRTYHSLADAIGASHAVAQVVAALLANPLPILIPCHRAVRDRLDAGEYVGGAERKRWLLDLERGDAEVL